MLGFHIGTFFIFAAMVLLIVVSVSVPIWDQVAFLKVDLPSEVGTLAFGQWGYCLLRDSGDDCSSSHLGYDIGTILDTLITVKFKQSTLDSLHNITKALILHPIAAGIAFLAWVTAAGAHRIGFLFASLIAFVAAVVTLVALILDFVLFGIVRSHVNGSDGPGSGASYSTGIWLVVAAFICLVLGSVTVCCGCFTERRRRRRSTY